MIVSPQMASSPANSADTAFNSSAVRAGMINQVLIASAVHQEREPLASCIVRNVPERGTGIARSTHEGVLLLAEGGIYLIPADSP